MKIEWLSLTPVEFEHFCVELMDLLNLRNINWRKGGADDGADITAEFLLEFPGINKLRKELWVVQCKRYRKSVSLSEKLRNALDFARDNEAQCILFITTSHFTRKVKSWFKQIEKIEKIHVIYLEGSDLERIVFNHPERFLPFFEEKKQYILSQPKISGLKPAVRILSILAREIEEIRESEFEITFVEIWKKCEKYGLSRKEVLLGLSEAEKEDLLQVADSGDDPKTYLLGIRVFNAFRQFNDLLHWGDL